MHPYVFKHICRKLSTPYPWVALNTFQLRLVPVLTMLTMLSVAADRQHPPMRVSITSSAMDSQFFLFLSGSWQIDPVATCIFIKLG